MRMLLLARNFPPQIGGTCRYYEAIYRRLPPRTVTAVTIRWPGDAAFDAGFPQLVTRFAAAPSRYFRGRLADLPEYLRWLALGVRQALWRRPSVVHCGEVLPAGLMGWILKRALGIPYVVFVHGEEMTTTRRLRYQSRVMRGVLASADHVIASCAMAKTEAESIVGRSLPASVVLPGVEMERFHPAVDPTPARSRYGLDGREVLLTVGLVDEERKGHAAVIRAMPEILRRVPTALYVIAGKGDQGSRLAAEARRLGVEKAVRLLGVVPDADLPALYAASRLFVMPNRQLPDGDIEGFGIVFLEASATGRPVIGGRSGGTGDSVMDGETGFLVDPTDEAMLAERIATLLTDDALAGRMGRRGREFAAGTFDWASRAARVWELSARVADQRRGRGPRRLATPSEPGLPRHEQRRQPRDEWEPYVLKDYDFVAFPPEATILDIGCGIGDQLRQLQGRDCVGVGLEPHWPSLVGCRRRGLPVLQARAEEIPLKDASLDGVICKGVIPYTDESRALAEISRVLKSGALGHFCDLGAGYYLRYLLRGSSWRFRFYGLRTLVNTWLYAVSRRRLPGFLGDTVYQTRRRVVAQYRAVGLSVVHERPSRTFLGFPVFLYHAVKKAGA